MLEAKVDGQKGNFILDTGASGLVLNKSYANQSKNSDKKLAYGITGEGNKVANKFVDSLIIQEMFFTDVHAEVVNLGHLEDAKGVKILGLVGAGFFKDVEIELDIFSAQLKIYKIDKNGDRLIQDINFLTQTPDIEHQILIINQIIFTEVIIADKKLRFCLDTGAETNVLNTLSSNKVIEHFTVKSKTNLNGSTVGNTSVLTGNVDAYGLNNHLFKQQPFILANLNYLETVYETNVQGILGFPFFSQGKVVINCKKKSIKMYFYK